MLFVAIVFITQKLISQINKKNNGANEGVGVDMESKT